MSRNSTAKNRKLSGSRHGSLGGSSGELRDKKTKQLIFHQCKVCAVAKVTRDSADALNEEAVGKLLFFHLRKRHSHGALLSALEDRLNFKKTKVMSKSPFRNWVVYTDIEHYFIFPQHPTMFMLAIKSDTPGKSLFETYKCKTKEDTTKLCEMVCKACRDPAKRLRDTPDEQRPFSALSEVSIHSNAISQPNLAMNGESADHEDLATLSENHLSTELRDSSPVDIPDVQINQLSPVHRGEEEYVIETQSQQPNYSAAPAFIASSLDDDSDRITYFDYDPIRGAILNNEGPIYMYLRRYESNVGSQLPLNQAV
ncbi:unnamed protein product [Dicrocoelium dendriticum]|nr:unnamed protein product [Dicrocoelium dendriticum]